MMDGSYGLDIILQDLGEPEEGKFKAIIPVNKEPAKKDKYDAVSVLKSFNSRKAERVFELTEEFKAFIEKSLEDGYSGLEKMLFTW